MSEELSARYCKTCKCIMPLTDDECDYCLKMKKQDVCEGCGIKLQDCTCEFGLHKYGEAIFWDCPCPRCSKHLDENLSQTLGNERKDD